LLVSTLLIAATTGARPLMMALVAIWGLGFGAVPVVAQSWMAQALPASVEGGLALCVFAPQGSLPAFVSPFCHSLWANPVAVVDKRWVHCGAEVSPLRDLHRYREHLRP
jgi:hypothetical protein